MTERETKEAIEFKSEDGQQSRIWNLNSILPNIFKYVDRKDLLEFSIACKKWNGIINPIIHKTIKLRCNSGCIFGVITDDYRDKCDTEIIECIPVIAKYAPLVKVFNFCYDFVPLRAIEFFQTFRFICRLSIVFCEVSQDQFLDIISPLSQLQELTLRGLRIKNTFSKSSYKEFVQLPSTLRKLSLSIFLNYIPELFIKTINSHNSLTDFIHILGTNEFLEPFLKPYPSLLCFSYTNRQPQSSEFLIEIFKQNPQISNLKLLLEYWNSEYLSYINSYFSNLEELELIDCGFGKIDYPGINFKLSQPTKIKKFKLQQIKLSNFSLSSILVNCSDLEELDLRPNVHYKQHNSISFINYHISTKVKKLTINCDDLSEGVLDSLLSSCPRIIEFDITLPYEWRKAMKSMHENCTNLQKLEIRSPRRIYEQERRIFLQEFYETEFFTSSPKCKSTLTHLTLKGFDDPNSKSEHFKNFKRLKSIDYQFEFY
jgi:hypothetical protein